MFNSAVIEEKKFKHSLRVGGRQPIRAKNFMSTGRPHHYVASLKRISSTSGSSFGSPIMLVTYFSKFSVAEWPPVWERAVHSVYCECLL